jgi:hypothetical protein
LRSCCLCCDLLSEEKHNKHKAKKLKKKSKEAKLPISGATVALILAHSWLLFWLIVGFVVLFKDPGLTFVVLFKIQANFRA